jgi:uncharacterized membrane protein
LSAGTAFLLVMVSFKIAEFLDGVIPSGEGTSFFINLLNGFGDQYLMLTTYFESINGSQEIGTFLIYLFFVVIGIPASIPLIVQLS